MGGRPPARESPHSGKGRGNSHPFNSQSQGNREGHASQPDSFGWTYGRSLCSGKLIFARLKLILAFSLWTFARPVVEVGTPVARRPPHRSRRAVFPHQM